MISRNCFRPEFWERSSSFFLLVMCTLHKFLLRKTFICAFLSEKFRAELGIVDVSVHWIRWKKRILFLQKKEDFHMAKVPVAEDAKTKSYYKYYEMEIDDLTVQQRDYAAKSQTDVLPFPFPKS